MTFGLQTEENLAREIMSKAASAGVNFIDTADVYPLGGGLATVGRTEEIVGRWLMGQRESYVLATKAVGRVGPNPWDRGASRKHLLDAVDASLRRLQTDYVDLYQLHSDDAATPLDETLEALDAIVKSGRARYVGLSNFLAYRVAKALGRCDLKGLARVVSIQPRYNLLFRQIERELLPLALEEGLGVIPYNPLAGGLLTGKHKPGSAPPPGTRFTLGTGAGIYQDRYWNDRAFATVQSLGPRTPSGNAADDAVGRLDARQSRRHRAAARSQPPRSTRRIPRGRDVPARSRAQAKARRAHRRLPSRRRPAVNAARVG